MEPTTYREPACANRRARIERTRTAHPPTLLWAPLAAAFGAGAMFAGHAGLIALAGAGAIAMAAHLVRLTLTRKKHGALAGFFGSDDVIETDGAWTSLDGRRRLRTIAADELPRWERLDPSNGETLESVRAPSSLLPPRAGASEAIERSLARVYGRARSPRCFEGSVDRMIARGDAAQIVLEVHRTGVLLIRKNDAGASVGDTWHADRNAAERQIEVEYGDRIGPWRDREREPSADEPQGGWHGFARSNMTI
jgi:hypothetical protein